MQETVYKKGLNAEADEEFNSAEQIAKMKIGRKFIFWKKMLKWYMMSWEGITRAYRKIEEVTSHTSCCETDFSIHKLVVVNADGVSKEIMIGQELYRHEPEKVIDRVRELHPEIVISKQEKQ